MAVVNDAKQQVLIDRAHTSDFEKADVCCASKGLCLLGSLRVWHGRKWLQSQGLGPQFTKWQCCFRENGKLTLELGLVTLNQVQNNQFHH
jgi:hypothetical protein